MTAEADILHDRPFASFCTIEKVEPLVARNALSGSTFIIYTDKGKFKLRVCKNSSYAAMLEDVFRSAISSLPGRFPKFYGRDGKYLLLEALDGYRQITREELVRNARDIGRICAALNQCETVGDHDHRKFFMSRLQDMRSRDVIDERLYAALAAAFERSLAKIRVRIALDMHDIHSGNFMIGPSGDILYVDEDGLGYRLQGQGIGKILKSWNRDVEYGAFKDGYDEVSSSRFLTPEYERHLELVEAVRSLNFKSKRGHGPEEAARDLATLKRIAGG